MTAMDESHASNDPIQIIHGFILVIQWRGSGVGRTHEWAIRTRLIDPWIHSSHRSARGRNNLPPLNDFRTLTGPVYVPEFFNNLPAPWTLHVSGSR
jgi:hypothetical protein